MSQPTKTALITGASSGIGEATATLLAQHHYNLILNARRADRLEQLAHDLEKEYGISTLVLPFDVRDNTSVETAITSLDTAWQDIDVLVNNAGLAVGLSTIDEGDLEDWDRMIDTNIKGLLYVTRQVAPMMVARKQGHIVNIGSIAGKMVYPNGNVYCATKHAVDALNQAMRIDLAKHPVKVTAINPGAVETEFSVVRFKGNDTKAKTVYEGFENLVAADIADAVHYVISRPQHVNINDLTIMPTAQPIASIIHRSTN